MVYPEELLKKNQAGYSVVMFYIDTLGLPHGIYILTSKHKEFDKEVIRLTKELPHCLPCRDKDGKRMKCYYAVYVPFLPQHYRDRVKVDSIAEEEQKHCFVEWEAVSSFQNGKLCSAQNYITQRLKYDHALLGDKQQVRGIYTIRINSYGEVYDAKVVRSCGIEYWDKVTALNINGTVYPSYVFSRVMAEQGSGCIVNISSMAAYSAITRVPGYSVAKTGISSFTQWLAADMALKFGDKIRVNALAPGFFIGDQNRRVLINPDGSLTDRSKKVLAKTPMKRFGDINELNGTVQFLCSDAASFITGTVIPVDGGFSCFSGV